MTHFPNFLIIGKYGFYRNGSHYGFMGSETPYKPLETVRNSYHQVTSGGLTSTSGCEIATSGYDLELESASRTLFLDRN